MLWETDGYKQICVNTLHIKWVYPEKRFCVRRIIANFLDTLCNDDKW